MPALTMRSAVVSEVGPREHNEDRAFASPRLAAVADGVGGATAGEVASALAIQQMVALDSRRLEHAIERELATAVADANAVIEFAIDCDPELDGMGTTLTAVALSNEGDYLVANVGDSRTYLRRDGQLRRLTRDQSLVQMLIDRGAITEAQARKHPQRSVVMEALDGRERALSAVQRVNARRGDRLLLCSDGVTDYVTDRELVSPLAARSAAAAAEAIVGLALEHGARDNVTAIVADVVPRTVARDGWLDYLPAAAVSA